MEDIDIILSPLESTFVSSIENMLNVPTCWHLKGTKILNDVAVPKTVSLILESSKYFFPFEIPKTFHDLIYL